jgi:hypothetical protein
MTQCRLAVLPTDMCRSCAALRIDVVLVLCAAAVLRAMAKFFRDKERNLVFLRHNSHTGRVNEEGACLHHCDKGANWARTVLSIPPKDPSRPPVPSAQERPPGCVVGTVVQIARMCPFSSLCNTLWVQYAHACWSVVHVWTQPLRGGVVQGSVRGPLVQVAVEPRVHAA